MIGHLFTIKHRLIQYYFDEEQGEMALFAIRYNQHSDLKMLKDSYLWTHSGTIPPFQANRQRPLRLSDDFPFDMRRYAHHYHLEKHPDPYEIGAMFSHPS